MAAEARSRNFSATGRRAFVADGQVYNRAIQRSDFRDFVPTMDLLHGVCYLFSVAQAVGATGERWPLYRQWLRACWQGRVAEVIDRMARDQERLGRPPPGTDAPATDPRRVLAEAWTYRRNNASRMDDPRYRREGLPTTSSLVESLVGEGQRAGKRGVEVLEPPGGGRGNLASGGGVVERGQPAGALLRRTPRPAVLAQQRRLHQSQSGS